MDSMSKFMGNGGKINHNFIKDFDSAHSDKVTSIIDTESDIIFWAYPGQGHTNGLPNKIIAFDRTTGKFAGPIMISLEQLTFAAIDTAAMLDDVLQANYPQFAPLGGTEIDLDDTSLGELNDPIWAGGSPVVGAFDSIHASGTFTGASLDTIIETGEYELNPHGRAFVNAVRALVDGNNPNISVRIGTRDQSYGTVNWSASKTPNARTGLSNFREDARYHRFEVTITGGFEHLFGGDAEFSNSGMQ